MRSMHKKPRPLRSAPDAYHLLDLLQQTGDIFAGQEHLHIQIEHVLAAVRAAYGCAACVEWFASQRVFWSAGQENEHGPVVRLPLVWQGESLGYFSLFPGLEQLLSASQRRVAESIAQQVAQRLASEQNCQYAFLGPLAEQGTDIVFRVELGQGMRVTYISPAVEKRLGYAPTDFYANPALIGLLLHPDGQLLAQPFEVPTEWKRHVLITRSQHTNGTHLSFELHNSPILDAAGRLISIQGIARDISQYVRASSALRRQTDLAELLQIVAASSNQALTVEEALQTAIDQIRACINWPLGHALVQVPSRPYALHSAKIWSSEASDDFALFRLLSESLMFEPGKGMPGRVLATGQAVWLSQIDDGSDYPRSNIIQDICVASGFAFPILLDGEIVAVLEFFSNTPQEIDESLLQVLSSLGAQISRVFERTQATAALQASEDRYRLIAENTADIVVLMTTSSEAIYVSPSVRHILGYEPKHIVGYNLLSRVHPEDAQASQEAWEQVLRQGEGESLLRFRMNNQDWAWIEIRARMTIQHGVPYVVAIGHDVTKNRMADQALRQAEARYRALVEQIPAIVYTADINKTSSTAYVSPQIESILGFTQEEWLSDPELWLEMVHPDDREFVLSTVYETHETQKPNAGEYRSFRRDGRVVWLHDTAQVVCDENGKPLYMQGVVLDITERKEFEVALRRSERLYRTLTHNFPNGAVFLVDHELRITIADGQVLGRRGYRPEDLEGRFLHELVSPRTYETIAPLYRSALAGKQVVHENQGKGRIYETFYVPVFNEQGDIFAAMAMSFDVTERKHAESALIEERALLARRVEERTADLSAANAELARAARLKDEFLANMSHELRTPLNAVLGLSEALNEQVYGVLNERQQQVLHTISESGHHLLELINDILDLAKIGAGKMQLEFDNILIDHLCQASLRMVRPTAHKKDIRLHLKHSSDRSMVNADTRRLKQILVNLLSNAVKFTPNGGAVGLEITSTRESIQFSVWDTGIGIAPEQQHRLFQPFVQLDGKLSRQYEGTGLGLALVSELVKLHNGSISLSSEVGVGSIFTISLPQPYFGTENDMESPAETTSPTPRGGGETLLLAEDNEANIATVRDYLASLGYQIIVARNGFEALAELARTTPALLLIDIHMPELDGLSTIERIRANPAYKKLPIIAVTALAMADDEKRCLQAGANYYISKPLSLRRLATTISGLLANH